MLFAFRLQTSTALRITAVGCGCPWGARLSGGGGGGGGGGVSVGCEMIVLGGGGDTTITRHKTFNHCILLISD